MTPKRVTNATQKFHYGKWLKALEKNIKYDIKVRRRNELEGLCYPKMFDCMKKEKRIDFFINKFTGSDIIAIQEYHETEFKRLRKHFEGKGYRGFTHMKNGGWQKMGGLLLVNTNRYTKLEEKKAYWKTEDKYDVENGVFVKLKDNKTGIRFITGTFHLTSGTDKKAINTRKSELDSLLKALTKINKENLPVVLGGDTNTDANAQKHTDDEAWGTLKQRKGLEGCLNRMEKKYITSWKLRIGGSQSAKIGVPTEMLSDDVFCSKNVEMLSFLEPRSIKDMEDENEVLKMQNLKMMRPSNPSDHAYLTFNLRIHASINDFSVIFDQPEGLSGFQTEKRDNQIIVTEVVEDSFAWKNNVHKNLRITKIRFLYVDLKHVIKDFNGEAIRIKEVRKFLKLGFPAEITFKAA